MNPYFTQTKIPKPICDWKSLWPEIKSPSDPIEIFPPWRYIDPLPTLSTCWPDGNFESLLDSVDLHISQVRIMRWWPNMMGTWHTDGAKLCTINWILEGGGEVQWNSKMELDNPSTNKMADSAIPTTKYRHKFGSIDDQYEEKSNSSGCLVNTNIPHRLINHNSIHRVIVGVFFDPNLDYTEVYNRLKSVDLV